MKSEINLILSLGAVPLLVYPAMLLADIMGLAAPRRGDTPILLTVVSTSFLLSSMAYPLIYAVCAYLAHTTASKNEDLALKYAKTPGWYLVFLVLLFAVWATID